MAFSEQELQISNKSYTNKDFESIYVELLEYAEKLSSRFSPVSANESDPFIVLLKLMAFVSDKVNYNVDKNVLERFMLSCTQDQSMRELTSMMGYNMKYYISATTNVVFKYNYSASDTFTINIPRYSIVSDGNEIQYVTLTDTYIDKTSGISSDVEVMQGILKDLTILDSSLIKLENLSERNRLYFPEKLISENGIFIESSSGNTLWNEVDNLNTQTYGDFVYTFGFDSKSNLPYIEFPSWIGQIIGGGIYVKYLVTMGSAGNVSSKALNTLSSNLTFSDSSETVSVSSSDIIVRNNLGANNGSDPEAIDESYQGFKKIIGTFDTLVSCRDFANAIFHLLDDNQMPKVSNVIISDRRSDINYAFPLMTYDEYGSRIIQTVKMNTSNPPAPQINAQQLIDYPLNPMITNTITKSGGYNESFKLLPEVFSTQNPLFDNSELYNKACLSHDIKKLATGDLLQVRDKHILDCIIVTQQKVTSSEQLEILNNINLALIKNYNPRNLIWGQDIAYDELFNVIENADARIRSISLQEPEHNITLVAKGSDSEIENGILSASDATQNSDIFKFIVAKNVFSGRVSLFKYDSIFYIPYDLNNTIRIDNITKIETSASKTLAASASVTLADNEVVQFITPKYSQDKLYTYGVTYTYTGSTIAADSIVSLGSTLTFTYSDSAGVSHTDTYNSGTIIQPNFELTSTGSSTSTMLSVTQQVAIMKKNQETITAAKKCYWIVNNTENKIDWIAPSSGAYTYTYLLNDGEYFFVSDMSASGLSILSSGTKLELTITQGSYDADEWKISNPMALDDISEDNLVFISSLFKNINFSNIKQLKITQNEIITTTGGDSIKNTGSASYTIVANTFSNVTGSLAINGNALATRPESWKCRILLDLNVGPDVPQLRSSDQKIKFYYGNGTDSFEISSSSASAIDKFYLSEKINAAGSANILVSNLSALLFSQDNLSLNVNKEISNFSLNNTTSSQTIYARPINLPIPGSTLDDSYPSGSNTLYPRYIQVYVKKSNENSSLTLSAFTRATSSNTCSCLHLNGGTSRQSSVTLIEGLNTIKIDDSTLYGTNTTCHKLIVTLTQSSGSTTDTAAITLLPMRYSKGINPELGLASMTATSFEIYLWLNYASQMSKFNLSILDDTSKQIEVDDTIKLSSPQSFYDVNNLANKWTIPMIDFESSNIRLAKNSIKS